MPHTGLEARLRFSQEARDIILQHITFAPPPLQITKKRIISARNRAIRTRHAAGEHMSDLAREYGVSHQRISQIVHGRHR